MALIDEYLAQNPYKPQATPKKKKGFLLDQISTVGGIAGGIAGLPLGILGVGAGAAGGSALGESLENIITGDSLTKNVGKEAVIGGILGAGPLRLARAATGIGKAGAIGAEAAAARSAKGFGVEVGKTVRGKVTTPDDANRAYDFITKGSQTYGGIRPGAPINQAKDAQNVYSNVIKQLDGTLDKINRPVKPVETKRIVTALDKRLINDPDITGDVPLATKFKTLVANKDIKGLEQLRREYDDIAFKANGQQGSTAKAAEARAIRDTIDEFVTSLSKDYKAIKGDYSLAKEALEGTSRASKEAKGIPLPFTGGRLAPQATSNLMNRGNALIASRGAGNASEITRGGVAKRVGIGAPLAGSLEGVVGGMQPEQQDSSMLQDPGTSGYESIAGITEQPASPYSQENLMADIQRDPQNADKYMEYYAQLQEVFGQPAEKPLSAEASKVIGNANSGLTSLEQLAGEISQSGVPKGTVIPGRSAVGGLLGNALGTAGYDTAARNVKDVITRLRTGAAITDSEERFYNSQLPQAFDDPATIQRKLQLFNELFNSVANRTGSAATDLESLVGSYR